MTPITGVVEHAGCALAYKVCGEGPPVLWIQGVGLHGDGWLPQIEPLHHRFRCVWFDNRGMGLSQPQAGPFTVSRMAEDSLRVLDAASCESAHIVGHSLGGLVALVMALEARKRVRSLSLLCTFANGGDVTRPRSEILWTGLRTRIGTRRQRRHAFLELVMPPRLLLASGDRDQLAEQLRPLFGHDLADQPPASGAQLKAMSQMDVTSRLAELSGIPTLVVSAEHDRIAPPRFGKRLADGIPGARFVELLDAGHGVVLHSAEEINGLVAAHIGSADG